MLKIVVTVKRKPGLTLDEFSTYYFDNHAPLARQVIPLEIAAGIIDYVQNHAVAVDGTEPPYDCVTEIGFADEGAMQRWLTWYQGPEGKGLCCVGAGSWWAVRVRHDVSPLSPRIQSLKFGVRRFSVPAGGDRARGALVPAVRLVVPRRRGTAGRAGGSMSTT